MGEHADDAINQTIDEICRDEEDRFEEPEDNFYRPTFKRRKRLPHDIKVGDDCPARGCKGEKIVLRKNKYSGVEFLGCDQYPKCKYSSSI